MSGVFDCRVLLCTLCSVVGSHQRSSQLRDWGVVAPFLEGRVSIPSTENSSSQEVCGIPCPPCIYLFHCFFTWGWMHECLCYALGYNPVLLYLLFGSDGSSIGPWELIQLAPVLWAHSQHCDFCFVFSTSSLSGYAPGSLSTFPIQSQNRLLPH